MPHKDIVAESVELLARMVEIPSLSGDENAVAELVSRHLASLSPSENYRIGNSVVAIWRGSQPGPTLLLCSHLDTVAPATGWSRDPFKATFEGDRLYGLGTNDAGASVVSMVGAVASVLPVLRGTVVLCIAAEEERGSNGFVAIEPLLPRYDAAIFGEPTGMGVATEMRGAMRVIMKSRGVAAHASRPWEGKNAVDTLVTDLAKIRALPLRDASPWGGATVEPTTVQGGASTNQLPDLITTSLDIRTTPERGNAWILQQLTESQIEFEVLADKRRPVFSSPQSTLVQAIFQANPSTSRYTFNGTCDMAFSTAPSVIMGPGHSSRSHVADEFITTTEIATAIEVYSSVIRGYLESREPATYAAA